MRVTAHGQGSAEAGNGDDMKFRKKPVVIEAVQFAGSEMDARNILQWAGAKCGMEMRFTSAPNAPCIIVVQTLEGEMRAMPKDWIIKGVNGEFYPCKPDIFEKTYEPV